MKIYFLLLRHFHPSRFYGFFAATFALTSLALGIPVLIKAFQSGLMLYPPTAILASSISLIAVALLVLSILRDLLAKIRLEPRQRVLRNGKSGAYRGATISLRLLCSSFNAH